MPLEIREARTADEVAAAGRVTVAANAEFAPADPDDPFTTSWARYLVEMADAAARAAQGVLLVAVEEGRVVGTVTLYLAPGSMQWRPEDAMFRLLAVDPPARGRGIGHALFQACLNRARAAGKRRMALHTTEWIARARAMYEGAGFKRDPEATSTCPASPSSPTPPTCSPPATPGLTLLPGEAVDLPVPGPLHRRADTTWTRPSCGRRPRRRPCCAARSSPPAS